MNIRKDVASPAFPVQERKPYQPPVLSVYGKVALLTQSAVGSCDNDGSGCTPVVGGTRMNSERRVKENIVRIGTHPLGIGLYLFDYKPQYRKAWGRARQFGVMAEEVETVLPNAVTFDRRGYKVVDYAMLGIRRTIH